MSGLTGDRFRVFVQRRIIHGAFQVLNACKRIYYWFICLLLTIRDMRLEFMSKIDSRQLGHLPSLDGMAETSRFFQCE